VAEALQGKVVVSTAVPVRFDPELGPVHVDVPQGSAAQQVAAMLPHSRVAAAFHSVTSADLKRLSRDVEGHVLVSGDDAEAKQAAMALVRLIPKLRPVDAGPLRCARYSEEFTVLLLAVNRIHGTHAGVMLTNLPPEDGE
jgi:NADPH-dependent F420 reductase